MNGAAATVASRDIALGKVQLTGAHATGVNAVTTIIITFGYNANCDGSAVAPAITPTTSSVS